MNCIARWKTGYTVTLLSISNLAGYKSVTTRLHGYIIVNQQLNLQQARNIPGTHSLCAHLEGVLPKSRGAPVLGRSNVRLCNNP